ncbi:MAG TPA: 6-phosphogluconolactonase [Longimicrobiaceae bacterium]
MTEAAEGRELRFPGRGAARVFPDAAAVARAAAERFAAAARAAAEARGVFRAALAGGSTPRAAYALLAEEPLRSAVPWERVHLFWGDERCVPPGHPRSNFRMAREALLDRVPLPPENVHRVRGELPPAEAAAGYARALAAVFGGGMPRFDLLHLGVGGDAHTASLFPFAPALRERAAPVARALHPVDHEPRVTLTPPALSAAARVELLAVGADKACVVRAVLRGPLDPFRLPAQLVRPASGEPVWLLDEAAARLLEEP